MVDDNKRSIDSIKQFLRRLDLIVYHYKNDRGEYKTFSMKPSEYISDADMIQKARMNEMREESLRLKELAKQEDFEDIFANGSEDEWSKMSEEERKAEADKSLAAFGVKESIPLKKVGGKNEE